MLSIIYSIFFNDPIKTKKNLTGIKLNLLDSLLLVCGQLLEEVLEEEISMTHLEIKIGALEKTDIDK